MAISFVEEHPLALGQDEVRVVVQYPRFRGGDRSPSCALVFGDPTDDCLVRVHSRCLYGDVFGSLECDCGPQLHRAIELVRAEGSGVLIYLDQEGRGAGLFAKARAYRMKQESGIDTFRSYEHHGLKADERSYEPAATLLGRLGIARVRLLTNNQAKVDALEAHGIVVKREPLIVPVGPSALDYMEAKRQRGHHLAVAADAAGGGPSASAAG